MENTTKLKFRPDPEWKLPQYLRGRFVELYGEEVNWSVIRRLLKKAKTYYLNEYGLTIREDGRKVSHQAAHYILAQFDGYLTEKKEQIYAWRFRKTDGGFEHTRIGTRYDFDKTIVTNSSKSKISEINK